MQGRVIVDAAAYHRFEYDQGVRSRLEPLKSDSSSNSKEILDGSDPGNGNSDEKKEGIPLTDEECMLAIPRVKGFDLKGGNWCEYPYLIPTL